MAKESIVGGLFGPTPAQIRQRMLEMERSYIDEGGDWWERMGRQAGMGLGKALGGLAGADMTPPELREAQQRGAANRAIIEGEGSLYQRALRGMEASVERGDIESYNIFATIAKNSAPAESSLIGKVDPSKVTPESLARFAQTNNYADLEFIDTVGMRTLNANQRAELYKNFTPESIREHLQNPDAPLVPRDNPDYYIYKDIVGIDPNGNPIEHSFAINKKALTPQGATEPPIALSPISAGSTLNRTQPEIDAMTSVAVTDKQNNIPTRPSDIPAPPGIPGLPTLENIENRQKFYDGVTSVDNLFNTIYNPDFAQVVGVGEGGIAKNILARALETPGISVLAASAEKGSIERAIDDARKLAPVSDTDFAKLMRRSPTIWDGVEVWQNWFENIYIPTITNSARAAYGDQYVNTYITPYFDSKFKQIREAQKATAPNVIDLKDFLKNK